MYNDTVFYEIDGLKTHVLKEVCRHLTLISPTSTNLVLFCGTKFPMKFEVWEKLTNRHYFEYNIDIVSRTETNFAVRGMRTIWNIPAFITNTIP